ncbi:MAG: hypothetical protein WBG41_06890 [Acidimicrobiales bacterium]
MSNDLSGRFDAGAYASDEPVHVFRCDRYGPADHGLWIPERLWHRLQCLGTAYELHLLPLLGGPDILFLNSQQVEGLNSELEFVAETVNDHLVASHIDALISLSLLPSQGASKDMIGIEFP